MKSESDPDTHHGDRLLTSAATLWHGCYEEGWKGVITPASFAHPAKFAPGLIRRIYRHCLERGYLKPGDVVGDCFGGIGTGGIAAAYAGLRWVGVELEPRFVEMGRANFALHGERWRHLGVDGPVLLQGDSRNFGLRIVDRGFGSDGVVSSPPYMESLKGYPDGIHWDKARAQAHGAGEHQAPGVSCHSLYRQAGQYGDEDGQIGHLKAGEIGAVIASPPYAETGGGGGGGINVKGYVPADGRKWKGKHPDPVGDRTYQGTGAERVEGNIEALKLGSVDGCVSSPPYADIAAGAGGLNSKPAKHAGQQSGRSPDSASQSGNWSKELLRYGTTEGQIARLDAVAASPPYADGLGHGGGRVLTQPGRPGTETLQSQKDGYGVTPGQIGALDGTNGTNGTDRPETYWEAVAAVYRSCYAALKPGGVIVLVVKDYVKAKKIVPLCDDTARLLEHVGFEPVERIRAMLVKEEVHNDLFSGTTTTRKERKSFFRRLAEKKGSPRIDWEEVLIFRK